MKTFRKILTIAALAAITVTSTSLFGLARADWVCGSSGYCYERTPSGYNGNYYKR
jgi:hypothetical protein